MRDFPRPALASASRLLRVLLCTLALLSCFACAGFAQEPVTLTGHLNRVWFDDPDADRTVVPYLMKIGDGTTLTVWVPLAVAQRQGGPDALDLKYVTLTGNYTDAHRNALRVESIDTVDSPPNVPGLLLPRRRAAQFGSKKYIVLPSMFTDIAAVPHPLSWYSSIFSSTPGLDHYFREISYGQLNVAGSLARDWQMLPNPKSYYLNSTGSDYDLNRLFDDATMRADAGVFFPDYYGIQIPINSDGPFSWGGGRTMDRDGVSRSYGTTWMMDWADMKTYAHEMGHSLGLPHSASPYGQTYGSRWDVMSNGYDPSQQGEYGRIPVHTIAYHKAKLGWIPVSRQYIHRSAGSRSLFLERLAQPASSTSYLMATVHIGGQASTFYTVEARRKIGYDIGIPLEGVVIHKVNVSDPEPAKVVDGDNDGDPNDEGAAWTVGETFTDAANGISISVTSETTTGYNVTIATTTATGGDTVTNTADSGPGSLRNAINWANLYPDTTIRFAIPASDPGYSGGVLTIRPASALPWITGNGTVIDGATQASATGNTNASGPEVVINGALAGDCEGLRIEADSCRISGLSVQGFARSGIFSSKSVGSVIGGTATGAGNVISGNGSYGIWLYGAGVSGNRIEGNRIGTSVDGTGGLANASSGIMLQNGASGNVIGGSGSAGNVISGNGNYGIWLHGTGTSGNRIEGNRIGTDAAGAAALPNAMHGVAVASGASGNTIGGVGAGNLISGNRSHGVWLGDAATTDNRVVGNRIGLNASGTGALPNGSNGVEIGGDAHDNTVGGTEPGAGNIISGNGRYGVTLWGAGVTANRVLGNRIGLTASDAALGNTLSGVEIGGDAHHNIVGLADNPAAANLISGNGERGILVVGDATVGNALRGNRIWGNGRLGIDLSGGTQNSAGVTANDTGDYDAGPNHLQNFPALSGVTRSGSQVVAAGTFSGKPNARIAIDLYADTAADPSGNGEGRHYVGTTQITLNSSGSGSFTVSGVAGGYSQFSATATDLTEGGTSEFGPCFASAPSTVSLSTLTVSPTSVNAGGSAQGTVTLTGAAPTGGTVVTLSSSHAAVTVPGTVTVPAGQNSVTFPVDTQSVAAVTTATVTAVSDGVTRTASLTVSPTGTTALSAITLSPAVVNGGSSASATVTLTGPAPAGGLVVSLASNQAAATVPASLTIAAGATSGTFTVTTTNVASVTTAAISASFGGGTRTATLTINPVNVTSLIALAVSPSVVNAGTPAQGTVTLSGAAPAGGAVVTLASSNTAAATVPASVTVAAGATSAAFTVTTLNVASAATVTISAAFSNVTRTASLTINPVKAPALSALAVSPASVIGGSANAVGTVTLSAAAPAGGLVVTLSSSNTAAATVPASVTVTAGQTTATFTVTSKPVTAGVTTTVSAAYSGVTRTALLNVLPVSTGVNLSSLSVSPTAVIGGAGATGTVTLSGPAPYGGAIVTLSSSDTAAATVAASVSVAAGQTTATFTVTSKSVAAVTPVTLSATCGVTRTVVLTVNPATLTALAVNPTSVTGGSANATGTVALSGPAPAGGAVVTLSSSNTAAATVPASVTVAAGASGATFTVATAAIVTNASVTITAAYGGTSRAAAMTVLARAGTVSAAALSLTPTSVMAGTASTGIVTLSGAAPAGAVVTLSSSNAAAASVPASVNVAAGANQATFTVTTHAVSTTVTAIVSASCGGVTRTATLTVKPAPTIVSFTPGYGQAGTVVTITGTNFTGATGVTFNGTAATSLTVVSATQIRATVPAGATTGKIGVTVPGGGAVSATDFVVPAWRAADIAQANDGSTRILMLGGGSLRIQKWAGSMQIGPAYTPAAGWTPVAVAADGAGRTFLLLRNGATSYQLWIMGTTGSRSVALSTQPAGGWIATDVSAAGDGTARVLLVSSSGQVKVVRISGSTATAGPVYTPASGWTAVGIAAGADNKTRLLWRNGTTRYQLWTLNAACARETAHSVMAAGGFTAREVSQSGDGTTRVLLMSPTGQIRVNRISGNTVTVGSLYTPASGYTPVGISADRDTSGRTRLLWQHSGGALNLWTLGPNGALQSSAALGVY